MVLERDHVRLRAHVLRAAAGALQKGNVLVDESDLDPLYNSACTRCTGDWRAARRSSTSRGSSS
jgi:hypothetical protein